MIMMGDKKKSITAILGPEPKPAGEEAENTSEVGHTIAQELIDAVASKDCGAVWEALQAAHEECMNRESY